MLMPRPCAWSSPFPNFESPANTRPTAGSSFCPLKELELSGTFSVRNLNNFSCLMSRLTLACWTANVTVDGLSNLAVRGQPPNEILQVASQNLDLRVGKIRMRLNNLFNGDRVLGECIRDIHAFWTVVNLPELCNLNTNGMYEPQLLTMTHE